MFRRRRFPVEIILVCLRWYCKYGISHRNLTEMMQERGVEVDPSTIMRWVHRYAPELEKRVRAFQAYGSTSWRVDETYVKVGGRWKYLFRAVGSPKHSCGASFYSERLTVMRNWPPVSITTDKLHSYPEAMEKLKPAIEGHEAPNIEVPEQHHRGRPWGVEAGHQADPRLSDLADCDSDDQRFRDHANDPARNCLRAREACAMRSAL